MSPKDKYDLIVRNLQEVVGEDALKDIIKKRPLKVYLGAAPTGKPHIGHFVTAMKLSDFLKAGCEITFLFADMHAYLDNMKTDWDLLEKRTKYYELVFKEMIKTAGAPLDKLRFVKGSDFQLKDKYTLDMYRLSALVTTRDTQRAGAEVVKQVATPKMSGLLYPMLQALDEEYLEVDAQFGGVDQRKIFMFAREFLPKIGYEKRIHLMGPLVPGLGESGKMSSSEPNSKIEFNETDKELRRKINKAFCEDGNPDNGLMALAKYLIFRFLESKGRVFKVKRPGQYGGDVSFKAYEELEEAFKSKKLSSIDLKGATAEHLIEIIDPIRDVLAKNAKLEAQAYK